MHRPSHYHGEDKRFVHVAATSQRAGSRLSGLSCAQPGGPGRPRRRLAGTARLLSWRRSPHLPVTRRRPNPTVHVICQALRRHSNAAQSTYCRCNNPPGDTRQATLRVDRLVYFRLREFIFTYIEIRCRALCYRTTLQH